MPAHSLPHLRATLLALLLGACGDDSASEPATHPENPCKREGEYPLYRDDDGDGWGTREGSCGQPGPGFSLAGGDCNDDDPRFSPEAPDVAGDGIDHDCSGSEPGEACDEPFVEPEGRGVGQAGAAGAGGSDTASPDSAECAAGDGNLVLEGGPTATACSAPVFIRLRAPTASSTPAPSA